MDEISLFSPLVLALNPTIGIDFLLERTGVSSCNLLWEGGYSAYPNDYHGNLYCDFYIADSKKVSAWNMKDSSGNVGYSGKGRSPTFSYSGELDGIVIKVRLYNNAGFDQTLQCYLDTTESKKAFISPSDGDIGSNINIEIGNKQPGFVYDVEVEYSGSWHTLAAKTTENIVVWSSPESLADLIPNANSMTLRFRVTTYYSPDVPISEGGVYTTTATLSIPESMKPQVTVTISDPSEKFSVFGGFLPGRSKIKTDVTATGIHGATIKSYRIDIAGKYIFNTASGTTSVINESGIFPVTVTVRDSRGNDTVVIENTEFLAYENPYYPSIHISRCDETGKGQAEGEYCKIEFTGKASSMDGRNTIRWFMYYREDSEESWTHHEFSEYNDNFEVSGQYIMPVDAKKSYVFRLCAVDKVGQIWANDKILPIAYILMQTSRDGTGITFGGEATEEETLVSAMKSRFKKSVIFEMGLALVQAIPTIDFHFNAETVADYTSRITEKLSGALHFICPNGLYINNTKQDYLVASGDSYSWHYEKWASGKMEAWSVTTWNCNFQYTYGVNGLWRNGGSRLTYGTDWFIEQPMLNVNAWAQSCSVFPSIDFVNLSDNTRYSPYIDIVSRSKQTATVYVSAHVIGKWK